MRTSLPKNAGPLPRSNSQHGTRKQHSFTEDYQDQENFELSSKGFRNSHIVGKSDKTKPGFAQKTGKVNDKKRQDEDELSSLSGFTASDNEEHDDMKFEMYPKSGKKKVLQYSDDEEENMDRVHHDIALNPKDNDLKARFAQLEMLKRENEEKRRQREILGERENEVDSTQNVPLKRPQTSYGSVRGNENFNTMNNSRTFMSRQKENMLPERPQTANVANMRLQEGEEHQEKPITFKPVYTKSINKALMEKKVYNYKDKNFKTLAKKSDPVSRFNAMKNEWNKTKFLKNTGNTGTTNKKEGRKLNLSERNQASKPDFIFHKYQPKYVFDV